MNRTQTKLNPNDFEPKRFALKYDPPQIIMEYMVPSVKKLYHHKIKLSKLKYDSNLEEIMKEVYEKHYTYLDNSKIKQSQILNLVEKLRSNLRAANNRVALDATGGSSNAQFHVKSTGMRHIKLFR